MDLLAPGQLFADRYRIERPLARGGMGAVFVATHRQTGNSVALKVLLPHIVNNARARTRFREEARVMAALHSEHIVQVHDAGLDDATNMPFIAMELLAGHSLYEEVSTSGACTPANTVLYLQHVAAGLDSAHGFTDAHGSPTPVVHRDLKPDNLFLTRRADGSPLVKILDFGLAKVTRTNAELSQDVRGTPEYMALEQLRGEAVCPQTDVWPLGLIAFFLLSGRSYWRAASASDSNQQALFAELLMPHKPSPSERIRDVGAEPPWTQAFDAWFLQCVAPDPSRRFRSAGEAIRQLEQALKSDPVASDHAFSARDAARSPSGAAAPEPTRPLVSYSSLPTRTIAPTPKLRSMSSRGDGMMRPLQGGDEHQGFEVRILPGVRVLRLQCWGLWTDKVAAQFVEAMRAGMHALSDGEPWYALAEISRYPAQPAHIAALHGALMQEGKSLDMERVCIVVDSALTQMQIARLADENRMPELVFFKDEAAGLEWVTRP